MKKPWTKKKYSAVAMRREFREVSDGKRYEELKEFTKIHKTELVAHRIQETHILIYVQTYALS